MVFKFTPFLVKFTPFVRPILCRLNFKSMFFYQFNYLCGQVFELCPDWPQTPHLHCAYCLQGGGVDTLQFNLHIIGCTKKGCDFNQKRCEFKFFLIILNEYMQNIHLGFDEVWKYLGKCVMENHYSCNILKHVMW